MWTVDEIRVKLGAEVQVLRLDPSDTLVVSLDKPIRDPRTLQKLKQSFEQFFPSNRVLVIEDIGLSVVSSGDKKKVVYQKPVREL